MMLGQHVSKCECAGILVIIAKPRPCSAGGIHKGIASDFILNQLLFRITDFIRVPCASPFCCCLPGTVILGFLADDVKMMLDL